MELKLEDYFVEYGDIAANIDNFQTLIGQKREFKELRPDAKEIPPSKRGQYFKTQMITQRYLRAYDRLYLYHQVGTGKSCAVIGLTEYYKKNRQQINLVYILVKGKSLKKEIRNQIVCRCTPREEYEDFAKSKKKEIIKMSAQRSNITKKLGKWYRITTYTSFANYIRENHYKDGKPNYETMKREFSGSIIWVDEAHNLRVEPDIGQEIDETQLKNKEITYKTLFDLFHTIERSKVILSTATPIINDVKEFIPFINLLLPSDNLIPENFDMETADVEDLKKYLTGYVSYVGSVDTGAIPIYLDETLADGYQTVVWKTIMSDNQEEGYNASKVRRYGKKKQKKEDVSASKSQAVYISQRQATKLVYPDGSFGSEGFKKFIKRNKTDNYSAIGAFKTQLTEGNIIKNIESMSCKYGDICKRLKLDKNKIPATPGNFFIYGEQVEGSGIISLALCLEAIGYEKFNLQESIFAGTAENKLPFCIDTVDLARERTVKISKKPRYAILYPDTQESNTKWDTIMETMNSYENRHGEYIKVLISSPVGRDGINVNNVLNIEIIDPEWNPAATLQALSRGIRATSHQDLIKEIAKEQGIPTSEVRLPINIRLHVAVTEKEYNNPDDEEIEESIDVYMYKVSEGKDKEIKRLERVIKQLSFDCWLNYKRNVKGDGVDGSAKCDYTTCKYECADPAPEFTDDSTYDLLYASEYVDVIISEIIEHFSSNFTVKLSELYTILPHKSKYIDMAVDKVIQDKLILRDRFGFVSYLQEFAGTLYLTREYPINGSSNYPLVNYVSSLITESTLNVDKVPSGESVKRQEIRADSQFDLKVDKLPIDEKIRLIEEALINLADKKSSDFDDRLLDKYKFYWFHVHIPEKRIIKITDDWTKKGTKQGRKAKVFVPPEVRKLTYDKVKNIEQKDTPMVYVHLLNFLKDVENVGNKYNVMANLLKANTLYRLYDPVRDDVFRDANPYEKVAYNEIVQGKLYDLLNPFLTQEIYGSLFRGAFRIHATYTEEEGATEDNRFKARGRVCDTWKVPMLLEFLWKIKAEAPAAPPDLLKYSKEKLITYISVKENKIQNLHKFETDKLLYYARWVGHNVDKYMICGALENKLRQDGLLFIP